LVDFLSREEMYCMNTFFQKKSQRRWTWKSPDGTARNEIDYILSSSKNICTDVSVLNRFDTGSDHRLVRACFQIKTNLERKKLMLRHLQSGRMEIKNRKWEYQNHLKSKLDPVGELSSLELNALNSKISGGIISATKRVCARKNSDNSKITPDTERLIAERRSTKRDSLRYTQLNKNIRKAIRRDIRAHKAREIERAIENNMNLKVLRSKLAKGRARINCMKNIEGEVVHEREDIVAVVSDFYEDLYRESAPRPLRLKRRHEIKNVGSEEIPEITRTELQAVLKELKNRKSPGQDRITSEMLKAGGIVLEEAMCVLLNKCLEQGKIPETWQNAEIILLFKKGDPDIANYRPISLLSTLYKVMTKIITKRLTNKFDFFQPVEQAGFRKGYSTIDHLQVIRTLVEKCTEYNIPLMMAFVDFQKAFDSVETWAFLDAMDLARVDSRYSNLIKYIYNQATLEVKINDDMNTEKIQVKRGVRQGDTISPKLFTLALEYAFKELS